MKPYPDCPAHSTSLTVLSFLVTYSIHLEIRSVLDYIPQKYLSIGLIASHWDGCWGNL